MKQNGFAAIFHLIVGLIIGIVIIQLLTIYYWPQNSNKLLAPSSPPQNRNTVNTNQSNPSAKVDVQVLNKYLTVEAALLGISDNASLYFKDLNYPDQEVTLDPTRSWIPASTIKSFVVLEAFRQRDLGLISFDHPISIQASNVVPTELETDDFPRLREGTTTTIGQLLAAMITQSDNTAYNTLLDILDRRNINNTLKNLGLTETIVGEKLNLDDNQFQQDLVVPGRQNNTTTVKDLADFFNLLYTHQISDAEEILAIFKQQKINNMIPALLPVNTVIAHKTGDWAPIYHDGGIIFKHNQPFILTIFTNANNPSAISQMAKVAFYNNSQSVGEDIITSGKKTGNLLQPKIYLSQSNQTDQVLAEETQIPQKFPEITAEDLGITPNDLSLLDSQDSNKINSAFIGPDSPFYGFKRVVENVLTHLPGISPVESKITMSQYRLSELKSSLKKGDMRQSEQLLAESEQNLSQALQQTKDQTNTNIDITSVKQVNDLSYATLAEGAKSISPDKKEQFVDMVYRFVKQNQKEVQPVIAKSTITNPLQLKPLIGTVKNISGRKVEVSFEDGSQQEVNLSTFTPIRDFHSDQIDNKNELQIGSKIAIIGQSASKGKIVPQFILKNIPHELPDRHQGTVVTIDPQNQSLEITEKGQIETVKVEGSTVVKSKDTAVSLEGIKAGSQVTVFGEYQKPPATPSAAPSPSSNSNNKDNKPSVNSGKTVINATSISITKNSSGKNEVTSTPAVHHSSNPSSSKNSNSSSRGGPPSPPHH